MLTSLNPSPSISNSQFNLNEFTLAQKQYLTNNELYSTKDVNGKDVITLSGGLAIYRFDQEKSALFSFSDVNGLKKCNSYPQINEAIAELERLSNQINSCKTQQINCEYIPKLPKDYVISIENKELVLKFRDRVLQTNKPFTEKLCLFDGLEDSKPEDGNTFYILNFNDPIKMQIFSFLLPPNYMRKSAKSVISRYLQFVNFEFFNLILQCV